MLRLTALIHTRNDARRLGRCLETVYPCDEIVIVDHGSVDRTVNIGREYGARIVAGAPGMHPTDYLQQGEGWVLCVDPHESLTEGLAASLFEWKLQWSDREPATFSFLIRQETSQGWSATPYWIMRMVPKNWQRWQGRFPVHDQETRRLEGELLRFEFP